MQTAQMGFPEQSFGRPEYIGQLRELVPQEARQP